MKHLALVGIALVLLGGTAAAQESSSGDRQADPISMATTDAMTDAAGYRARGWGAMAFVASALLSPLLGGGGVILAANMADPAVQVPPMRLAAAQSEFDEANELLLYQAQYQETLREPIRRDRSRRAWIGTGIGFGINLIIVFAVLAA